MCAFACFFASSFVSAATWKLFFYMDASDNLADMAFKNITDMMRGNPNDSVEIVIQLHAYDSIALRYQIINASLVFNQEVVLSGDAKQDFIDAASWAFANNTSDYTMLIFANHGWGALDPRWNPITEEWEAAEMSISNNGTNACPLLSSGSSICPLTAALKTLQQKLHEKHRGFMFNASSRSYLTNRALAEGLAYVKGHFLYENPIDIVAFDTCMGSMLEVATCVSPCANYLVGVQSCALSDGFDYQAFVAVLNQGEEPGYTAAQLVDAFDRYYAHYDNQGIYTCAALDMACVNAVNNALDAAVLQILDNPAYIPFLMHARDMSPRFCLWPIYTDLVAFFKLFELEIVTMPIAGSTYLTKVALNNLYNAVDDMVVARCGGSSTQGKAHGFSIYLPSQVIDDSYSSSLFAHQSQWINLLQVIC